MREAREILKQKPAKVAMLIKALLAAYIITGIMLLILALMVFKMNLKQGNVEIGILLIYIASSFVGGFLAGKMGKHRKFIWGLLVGTGYMLVLFIVSFALNGSITGSIPHCLMTLIMCMGGGMLGGMVS